jgi:hypothetical protein
MQPAFSWRHERIDTPIGGVETTSGEAEMHTDMWYHLMIRELSEDDLLSERLREAEAVHLPGVEPEERPEGLKKESAEGKPTS